MRKPKIKTNGPWIPCLPIWTAFAGFLFYSFTFANSESISAMLDAKWRASKVLLAVKISCTFEKSC